MYQVPARVWNEIAASEELASPSFERLMKMNDEQILQALDEQAKALEARGVPDSVIVAYQRLAPLLAENEAISRYINRTGNTSLREALPEILNAEEAVVIATQDQPLSKSEQKTLLDMLKRLEPASSLNV